MSERELVWSLGGVALNTLNITVGLKKEKRAAMWPGCRYPREGSCGCVRYVRHSMIKHLTWVGARESLETKFPLRTRCVSLMCDCSLLTFLLEDVRPRQVFR